MTPELVRGSCPSVHDPFVELDGALVRVRLPGGRLPAATARALAEVADSVGAGPFELTNRANLQLRGIPIHAVPVVQDAVVATGMVPADAGADARRNVLASPTAGVDIEELVDTRPLVSAIADRLASARDGVPSHKFGVLVDGGGAVHVRARRHDVVLGAVHDVDGAVCYEVRFADALPLTRCADETVWVVDPADVMDVIDAAIGGQRASGALMPRHGGDLAASVAPSQPAVGLHPQHGDSVWVGAVPMLGRLDVRTLGRLAELARGELRVTPWRGVVLVDVEADDAATLTADLEAQGLICDPDHPANSVVACSGSRGCAAGLADTQADARAIIDRLTELPPARRPESIHVSGCEKGCARSQPAELSLVAGPIPGSYDLASTVLASPDPDYSGRATPKAEAQFGQIIERGLDPEQAVDAIVSRGSAR